MKSIKQQYIDLKEGRMSQHNFMRSVRMSLPQYITNVTSFNDTVKILKNKGILNEATINSSESDKEQWFEEFQNAIENMDLSPEKKAKAMKALDHVDVIDLYGMFQPGPGANAFIGDIDDILARAGDEEESEDEDADLAAMLAKYSDEDLGPEKYKFQDFPGGLSEVFNDDDDEAPEDYEDPDMFDAYGMDASEGLNEKSYKVSKDAIPVSSLKKGDVLSASGLEIISISAGAKTPSGKIEVTVKDPKTGKEVTKIWNKATKVVVKKDLNEAKKTIATFDNHEEWMQAAKEAHPDTRYTKGTNDFVTGDGNKKEVSYEKFVQGFRTYAEWNEETGIGKIYNYTDDMSSQVYPAGSRMDEAKKKKEAKTELNPNQIHPQELRMGIKVELEHTDDLDKAKKIALDHLAENPFYYTALKLSGIESPSAPKYKAPVEKKAKKKKEAVELVDKDNAMQKVKMPKVVKEAKLNLFPGEEPNAVVKQAMEWVDTNLPSISDEIEFQQSRHSPDEAILRYGYWDILPEDAVAKLKSQFNVEADSDEMDDQLPINYYRLKLKKSSFRPGVDLGKSFDKFKSTLEEIVREVVNETFDGRDNLDAENEY